jgi:hypothetical protein
MEADKAIKEIKELIKTKYPECHLLHIKISDKNGISETKRIKKK